MTGFYTHATPESMLLAMELVAAYGKDVVTDYGRITANALKRAG
jgi:hypothetical protein